MVFFVTPFLRSCRSVLIRRPMAIHSEPGIFSHTNIDPTDDLSFWTTAGFSNSFIGTVTVFFQTMNVYSWQSAWATLTPPQVIFEGSENIPEVENLPSCNNYPTAMQLQVTSLPNCQPGDVLIAVVAGGGGTSASATGWTQLGSPLVSNGSCGQSSTSWVFAHQYPATDPLPYVFNVGVSAPTDTCNTNFCWAGEAAGYLVDYRGASSNFSNYTEYGYPNNSDVNPRPPHRRRRSPCPLPTSCSTSFLTKRRQG